MAVLEHLVSALNIFLRSAAMNCRMRLCRLGEELLPSILYVWADMRPSPALKEEIVEFFNLQICVHHPKGAKTQDTGSSFLKLHFKCWFPAFVVNSGRRPGFITGSTLTKHFVRYTFLSGSSSAAVAHLL